MKQTIFEHERSPFNKRLLASKRTPEGHMVLSERNNHKLPDNYITKSEAQALGWVASKGNLADVAPGKSIGGDIFSNREGKLPAKSGRTWREADINYTTFQQTPACF